MAVIDLKSKPLIEALLEVRWSVDSVPGPDPHYQLLIGRLYDRLQSEYPFHQPLEVAQLPTEIAAQAGVVQHQLRAAPEGWPIIQIGPGIMTVNVTSDYTWADFGSRCRNAVERLFEVHPSSKELQVASTTLRYIDAIDFDWAADNVLEFLREKMKVNVGLA